MLAVTLHYADIRWRCRYKMLRHITPLAGYDIHASYYSEGVAGRVTRRRYAAGRYIYIHYAMLATLPADAIDVTLPRLIGWPLPLIAATLLLLMMLAYVKRRLMLLVSSYVKTCADTIYASATLTYTLRFLLIRH